jgi:hypothetical protein
MRRPTVQNGTRATAGAREADPSVAPHVLREYALLADGERGALVGPRGEIPWLCAPRWDSDGVFSSLIGGAGHYTVTPTTRYVWGGAYEPASLIWRSRWITEDGIVECREALAFPGNPRRVVLLRQIHAVEGPAHLKVTLQPAAGFGHESLRELHHGPGGEWLGRVGPLWLRWRGGDSATVHDHNAQPTALQQGITLPEGARHDLILELSDNPPTQQAPDPARLWQATEAQWHHAVPTLEGALATRDARHSYAVLRGLTSCGGGMVAAATTSLPERADTDRNYDYRYVWIRDQCYAGQAVAAAGPHPLLDDAVRFVAERILTDGADLKPAYTTTGGQVPDQRPLNLPGYPGGSDIIGNHVNTQFQLDALGESLLLFAAAARHNHLEAQHTQAISTTVAAIEQRCRQPDAGIWELANHHWAHSRLTCAAGLRAIAAHAPTADAAACATLADTLLATTNSESLHPSGRWQRAPHDPRIDAALLLPAIRGALPAHDPRSAATLRAVRDELTEDGYVYRYRHDQRPLRDAEGAFLLCGFLMAMATHQHGNPLEAARWFERNRSACGPPGLFAEEYDVTQRQLRGNLPQAFVHAAMLESAVRLAQPWEEPTSSPP